MRAVEIKGDYEYTLEEEKDLDPSERTVFVLTHLTGEQQDLLDDALGYTDSKGQFFLTTGKSGKLALDLGLKEIKNWNDKDGNPVKLERDQTFGKNHLPGVGRPWKRSIIDKMPREAQAEVATVIKNSSYMEDDERKNS